jgi:hypothetical protein
MEDDVDTDWEVATDEESLKIRRLEREIAAVSTSEDRRLFLFIGIGLVPVLLYALSPGPVTQWIVILVVPVSILGGLGYVIFQNIRRKRCILIKHGLQCSQCGFIPSTLTASGVLGSRKCQKCGSRLKV